MVVVKGLRAIIFAWNFRNLKHTLFSIVTANPISSSRVFSKTEEKGKKEWKELRKTRKKIVTQLTLTKENIEVLSLLFVEIRHLGDCRLIDFSTIFIQKEVKYSVPGSDGFHRKVLIKSNVLEKTKTKNNKRASDTCLQKPSCRPTSYMNILKRQQI